MLPGAPELFLLLLCALHTLVHSAAALQRSEQSREVGTFPSLGFCSYECSIFRFSENIGQMI